MSATDRPAAVVVASMAGTVAEWYESSGMDV